MTAAALDPSFQVFARGEQREAILESWRYVLRSAANPETGAPFTETEIAAATAPKSRWYAEADAVDLVLLSQQARAGWLADQLDPERASTEWLVGFHAKQWDEQLLPATGGSGLVRLPAVLGTTIVGSTAVPDPSGVALTLTDPAGNRYQALFGGVAGAGGYVDLALQGIDTGSETNLPAGAKLSPVNPPLGVMGPATVLASFTGGLPRETDAELARRIVSRVRRKPGAGNDAHWRSWARQSSNAVADAMVYPCAFHAGSLLVAVLQKRGNVRGPLGRVPSIGTLAAATSYLVPPGSAVAPKPPHVVVTGVVTEPSNMVISLDMPRGRSTGWRDLRPWPTQVGGNAAIIVNVSDQTHFRVGSPSALPTGGGTPTIMVWDASRSTFERLLTVSVTALGGGLFDVVLSGPPTTTLAVGQRISPYTDRAPLLDTTVEAYFDSLGPGEVVDLSSDLRAHRAFRTPKPAEEYPQRAGAGVLNYLRDVLAVGVGDMTLDACSVALPPLPPADNLASGPRLVVAGHVAVSPMG